jgi:hypothetical protein
MTRPTARDPIYRGRAASGCVSHDDLAVGDSVRTGVRKAVDRYARRIGSSWRVDETYICIRGKWHYLYRAVDKRGKTVDFLLRPNRGIVAAQDFFRKALATNPTRWPRKVTLDGHVPSHRALRLLRRENPKWKYVEVRSYPRLPLSNRFAPRAKKLRVLASLSGCEPHYSGDVRGARVPAGALRQRLPCD